MEGKVKKITVGFFIFGFIGFVGAAVCSLSVLFPEILAMPNVNVFSPVAKLGVIIGVTALAGIVAATFIYGIYSTWKDDYKRDPNMNYWD